MATLELKPGRERRLVAGHPWVYAGEVRRLRGEAEDGEAVVIRDHKGRFLGKGFLNQRSQIVARICTRENVDLDESFFRKRLSEAIAYRKSLGVDANALRLVYGESDLLPGLIVDQYADVLVMQALTLAIDRRKPLLVRLLVELLKPQGIYERSDVRVREYEELEQTVGTLWGEVPSEVQIEEQGVRFMVDVQEGQKTGFYLDQRDNRRLIRGLAEGRLVLDAFSYSGGFGVAAAAGGAKEVICVDQSAEGLRLGARNAALNGCENRVRFMEANAFDQLRAFEKDGRRFDLIILDPPAFTKSKETLPGAIRGYKEINLRAMRLLRPGGYLLTCSCSHHLSWSQFRATLAEAAGDVGRTVRIEAVGRQAKDHPVLLNVDETEYLKGFLLAVL